MLRWQLSFGGVSSRRLKWRGVGGPQSIGLWSARPCVPHRPRRADRGPWLGWRAVGCEAGGRRQLCSGLRQALQAWGCRHRQLYELGWRAERGTGILRRADSFLIAKEIPRLHAAPFCSAWPWRCSACVLAPGSGFIQSCKTACGFYRRASRNIPPTLLDLTTGSSEPAGVRGRFGRAACANAHSNSAAKGQGSSWCGTG